jgi:hypothetical protein
MAMATALRTTTTARQKITAVTPTALRITMQHK